MKRLAFELLKLGVSDRGTTELLSYDLDIVENQLRWLPYRKARRPEALIIEAVRKNFSAPKEIIHANLRRSHPRPPQALDDAPKPPR